jgi:hypothetical protein
MTNFSEYSKLQQLQKDVYNLQDDLNDIKINYIRMLNSLKDENILHLLNLEITIILRNTNPSISNIKKSYFPFKLNLEKVFSNYYSYTEKSIDIKENILIKLINYKDILASKKSLNDTINIINILDKNILENLTYSIKRSDQELADYNNTLEKIIQIFYDKYIVIIFDKFNELLLLLEHKIKNKLITLKNKIDEELKLGNFFIPDFNLLFQSDEELKNIIYHRHREMMINIQNETHLSAIFMMGSILEGLLLHVLSKNPKLSNSAKSTPKKDGKPKPYTQWTLNNMMVVAHELRWIEKTTSDFSHLLKDYRNFIHPREQQKQEVSNNEIANTYQLNLKAFELVIKKLQEHVEDGEIKS